MNLKFKILIGIITLCTSLAVFALLMNYIKPLENVENKNESNEKVEEPKNKFDEFNATTIKGKTITNDIFTSYDLTMVNIWATFCNPCVEEMDELDELYKSLPKGVNLITICYDAESKLDLAKQILETKKTTFDTVIANRNMINNALKNYYSFPTTIFINKNGEIVGSPFIGAPRQNVVDTYMEEINKRLEEVRK